MSDLVSQERKKVNGVVGNPLLKPEVNSEFLYVMRNGSLADQVRLYKKLGLHPSGSFNYRGAKKSTDLLWLGSEGSQMIRNLEKRSRRSFAIEYLRFLRAIAGGEATFNPDPGTLLEREDPLSYYPLEAEVRGRLNGEAASLALVPFRQPAGYWKAVFYVAFVNGGVSEETAGRLEAAYETDPRVKAIVRRTR